MPRAVGISSMRILRQENIGLALDFYKSCLPSAWLFGLWVQGIWWFWKKGDLLRGHAGSHGSGATPSSTTEAAVLSNLWGMSLNQAQGLQSGQALMIHASRETD